MMGAMTRDNVIGWETDIMKYFKPFVVALALGFAASPAMAQETQDTEAAEAPAQESAADRAAAWRAERAARMAEGLKTLPGIWAGDYFCTGSGQHGLTLQVDALGDKPEGADAYAVTATLWFYPLMSNPASPKGAFRMAGTMDSAGGLDLKPTEWIEQPSNYGAANIDGVFDYADDEIRGLPAGAGAEATGCKAMHLTRLATAG